MRVYLILQKQLEEMYSEKRIVGYSIQRMDQKRWIPIFDVKNDGENIISCSLRVQSGEGVRTWADLRLLAEWLKNDFSVNKLELYLDDPDFSFPDGDNNADDRSS
ncbi:TPA: hypothetical protein MN540_005041 [Klebsiella pneumoniae]|nr:hypothetical protein [Klebsiella pneumoniae]